MATTVKRKLQLGTLFLFLMVLLTSGVGIFHLVRLKSDAKLILQDNYESLGYCHSMERFMDSFAFNQPVSFERFDSVLKRQESNITEAGEREATKSIRANFAKYRAGDTASLHAIQSGVQEVLRLNMAAIESKNAKAGMTADTALTYISILSAIVFLIGFTFSYNFPAVLTVPISALTEGIQEISRKNYKHRIHLNRKDEFGQMADSFNTMAERLEYFESSNLNKIIFEKSRAESVINSLKDASIGIDKNGVILFANNQALQLLGIQAKDIVGKPAAEITRRNDLLRFLLEENGTLPFKIVLDNRENYFTKEVMDITQDGSNSKVIVLRNITSFKELDVAKTNFIATISHELKTPLASSDISLKLLEDERIGKLSEEQRELIQNLRQDNQRMLRILSELLNMAQVETGKIQLEIGEVSPAMIMGNAIQSVLSAAREKNIRILKEYPENLPTFAGDAEKTTWILSNFLSNAIRYSPADSAIRVNIERVGDQLVFSVNDQGPGIPEEYRTRVFDRFFKIPGSKGGGTGLGLSISKEFIEAEGGRIWVKSEPGSGSTFGFDLPVVSHPGGQ